MNIIEAMRLFFGSVFILFLPGLAWSYIFFARGKIDWVERIALSLGLSIALLPLAVFWLNWLFHVPITLLSTCLIASGLIAIPIGYLGVRKSSWGKKLGLKLKSIPIIKYWRNRVASGLIAISIGYLGVRKSSWGTKLGLKLKSIPIIKHWRNR